MSDTFNTRYESADASPGFMLWRVTNRWQSVIRRALQTFDITHVQFVLLAALTYSAAEEGLTQVELAQLVRADPMMVSQVLRALESKGLIVRRKDPADGRALRVLVTPEGRAIAQAANVVVEDADEAFFGVRSAQPQRLIDHLRRLDQDTD